LVFGFIRGLMKGLFVEVASLVSLVAGVYGAIHFSYFVGDFLKEKVSWEERYITIVAFAVTFAVIVLAISLLGKLFTKLADFAYLGWINKALGGVFGALKLAMILSIILMVFDKLNNAIPFVDDTEKEQSVLYEPVKTLAITLFPDFIKVASENIEKESNNSQ
jgi:membrane protein required for colicin V production